MAELFEKLGINWTLFVAQLVNFLLLFFILKRFLFKPVQTLLVKRRTDAEKILVDQKNILHEQHEIKMLSEKVLQQAQKDAQDLLAKAEAIAEQNGAKLMTEARAQIEQLQHQHEKKMAQEIEVARQSLAKETVSLALLMVAKVMKDTVKNQAHYEEILAEELDKLAVH